MSKACRVSSGCRSKYMNCPPSGTLLAPLNGRSDVKPPRTVLWRVEGLRVNTEEPLVTCPFFAACTGSSISTPDMSTGSSHGLLLQDSEEAVCLKTVTLTAKSPTRVAGIIMFQNVSNYLDMLMLHILDSFRQRSNARLSNVGAFQYASHRPPTGRRLTRYTCQHAPRRFEGSCYIRSIT